MWHTVFCCRGGLFLLSVFVFASVCVSMYVHGLLITWKIVNLLFHTRVGVCARVYKCWICKQTFSTADIHDQISDNLLKKTSLYRLCWLKFWPRPSFLWSCGNSSPAALVAALAPVLPSLGWLGLVNDSCLCPSLVPVAFGKPGSGRAAGEETKAAAGEIFKCQVSESGGLPVKADGGALRPHT